jgi:hypothetical protein
MLMTVMLFISSAVLLLSLDSHADHEFLGTIESRPDGKAGTWVIGGQQVVVTERTRLDEDHGPLLVGACAEVEYKGNFVEEIASEEKSKCRK